MRRWRRWLAPAFTGFTLVGMLYATSAANDFRGSPSPALLAAVLVSWLPLAWRTRRPIPVLVAVVAAEALHLILIPVFYPVVPEAGGFATFQPVPLATAAAVWTVASRRTWRIGWPAGAAAGGSLFLIGLAARPISDFTASLVMLNVVLLATAAGVSVSARREHLRRVADDRRQEVNQHVVAERLRIARDLHDVLAHHLTLVNAQAGVAGYLMTVDAAAASTALTDIADHTRKALDELRATVGLLRYGDDPAEPTHPVPGLDRITELVTGMRTSGAEIAVHVTGEPRPLPAASDLAAYRIVQEALTNAAKHAPGAPTTVELRWSPASLEVIISNGPGGGRHRLPAPGTGHGLIGMAERARACGGHLSTGSRPDGGYRVHAVLPTTL